jgi:hypothetical protein
MKFGDCWSSSFKDYKVNGKPLYTKVTVGKESGYTNKFDTFLVPTVLVVNKAYLEANKNAFDVLFDATTLTFNTIKGEKKFTYYPSN